MNGMIILSSEEVRQLIRDEISNVIPKAAPANTKRYNVEEAAAYLNLAVGTFRQYQHRIGGIKIGKRWIFTQAELDRFVENNRRRTQSEIKESI